MYWGTAALQHQFAEESAAHSAPRTASWAEKRQSYKYFTNDCASAAPDASISLISGTLATLSQSFANTTRRRVPIACPSQSQSGT